jgi:hypothetical protein
MPLPTNYHRKLVAISDENGILVDIVTVDGVNRLAVETSAEIQIGAVELDDGATDTRASIKGDGAAMSPAPNDGGLLISGRDDTGPVQRHIRVNSSGALVTEENPAPNEAAVTFQTVTVVVAGTPVNAPSIVIPDGYSLTVRFRTTQTGMPRGFISNSAANVVLSASRSEMLKGDAYAFQISNANLLWFDSNSAGAIFELIVEQ